MDRRSPWGPSGATTSPSGWETIGTGGPPMAGLSVPATSSTESRSASASSRRTRCRQGRPTAAGGGALRGRGPAERLGCSQRGQDARRDLGARAEVVPLVENRRLRLPRQVVERADRREGAPPPPVDGVRGLEGPDQVAVAG